jgi:predicted DNA binding CopG/RHH family protein
MKPEYDMTDARRATEVDHLNRLRADKTRLTVVLDDDLLETLRQSAAERGLGYQELIGLALREYLGRRPIDEDTLRRVLREELHTAA